jgi:hypothetical protein
MVVPKLKSDSEPAPPGTQLDEAALAACSHLADGMDAADSPEARVELTNKVVESANKSRTANFADRTLDLQRTADASEGGLWLASAQAFVIICRQIGWSAGPPTTTALGFESTLGSRGQNEH